MYAPLVVFPMTIPFEKTGDLNWYVASGEYGFVELAHQILIHCALDNKSVLEENDR